MLNSPAEACGSLPLHGCAIKPYRAALLNPLILDIKIVIATKLARLPYPEDVNAWNTLMMYDEEFREYAHSKEGLRKYATTFVKFGPFSLFSCDSTVIARKTGATRIFGKLNSIMGLPILNNSKIKIYMRDGELHRDGSGAQSLHDKHGDLPAIESDVASIWMKYGNIHRENDLPARIARNVKQWYRYDLLHRDDFKPASILCDDDGNEIEWSYWVRGSFKYMELADGSVIYTQSDTHSHKKYVVSQY
jgi:hypothetical protein